MRVPAFFSAASVILAIQTTTVSAQDGQTTPATAPTPTFDQVDPPDVSQSTAPTGSSLDERLVQAEADLVEMKKTFIDNQFTMQDLRTENAALRSLMLEIQSSASTRALNNLNADVEALRAELAALQTDGGIDGEDLAARLVSLEAAFAALPQGGNGSSLDADVAARLDGLEQIVANLPRGGSGSNVDLGPLLQRLAEAEAQIAALQADDAGLGENGGSRVEAPPIPPIGNAPFEAETGSSGRLTVYFKSQITNTLATVLPTRDNCGSAGTWFDETYAVSDYRAFFVREDNVVLVCSRSRVGWRVLRGNNTTRAHYVKEAS